MFDQIPKNRLLIYTACLGCIPLIAVLVFFSEQRNQASELKSEIVAATERAKKKEQNTAMNRQVMGFYSEADHFYITKYLEPLRFLQEEAEGIQKLLKQETPVDTEALKQRLAQLTGTDNALTFTQGTVHSFPNFQETTETLVQPVEVSETDLAKILSLVEGIPYQQIEIPPNRPHLIITDFQIEKKPRPTGGDSFVLQMKLLKREYF